MTSPQVHLTQSQFDRRLADGGLPPVPGVTNIQVLRACRESPEQSDGRGWTYHHHVDMGCWKGKLYIAWNSCEKDEDVWPSRELYSTSEDGVRWSKPAELFPQGLSAALRMYFFHAPNGRMLAIAGLLRSADNMRDANSLVVREIRPDVLAEVREAVHLLPVEIREQDRVAIVQTVGQG